jgi:hypothetical protein
LIHRFTDLHAPVDENIYILDLLTVHDTRGNPKEGQSHRDASRATMSAGEKRIETKKCKTNRSNLIHWIFFQQCFEAERQKWNTLAHEMLAHRLHPV